MHTREISLCGFELSKNAIRLDPERLKLLKELYLQQNMKTQGEYSRHTYIPLPVDITLFK